MAHNAARPQAHAASRSDKPQWHELRHQLQLRQTKVRRDLGWNKLLLLPVLIALSWYCGFSDRLQLGPPDRWLYFACAIVYWILVFAAFLALLDRLVPYQTTQVLERMRQLQFIPSGHERNKPVSLFGRGFVFAYYYASDASIRRPAPPLVLAAVTDYYEACTAARCSPQPGLYAAIEYWLVLGLLGAMLAGAGLGLLGVLSTGPQLALLLGLPVAGTLALYHGASSTARELGLLQALLARLDEV